MLQPVINTVTMWPSGIVSLEKGLDELFMEDKQIALGRILPDSNPSAVFADAKGLNLNVIREPIV